MRAHPPEQPPAHLHLPILRSNSQRLHARPQPAAVLPPALLDNRCLRPAIQEQHGVGRLWAAARHRRPPRGVRLRDQHGRPHGLHSGHARATRRGRRQRWRRRAVSVLYLNVVIFLCGGCCGGASVDEQRRRWAAGCGAEAGV